MAANPLEEKGKNVICRSEDLSARIIPLPPGGAIPPCEMASNVVFAVISGKVEVEVNGEEASLAEGWCLITEPAVLSMRTEEGARILGIQVPRRA